MPTNAKTKAKQAAERKSRTAESKRTSAKKEASAPKKDAISAIDLLEQDHREVETYFEEYEDLEDEAEKGELAQKICLALTVHAQIEEEIFYPQARKATKDDDLLDEATVEHASAKQLIAEIENMAPGDDLYDAKVKVLGDMIKHHVEEEEEELFPEVSDSGLDVHAVGAQLEKRKRELMQQLETA